MNIEVKYLNILNIERRESIFITTNKALDKELSLDTIHFKLVDAHTILSNIEDKEVFLKVREYKYDYYSTYRDVSDLEYKRLLQLHTKIPAYSDSDLMDFMQSLGKSDEINYKL